MTPTLLHLDASPRGDRSVSRAVAGAFAQSWAAARGARVLRLDLRDNPPPLVTEAYIAAAYTPPAERTPEQRAQLAYSDGVLAEVRAATHVLIATPMFNFGMPAALKAWVDQLVRVGESFSVDTSGLRGLLSGRKVLVLVATGSDLRPGAPYAAADFLSGHIKTVFGFIGLTDVEVIHIPSQTGDDEARAAGRGHANAALAALADSW